MKENRTFIFLFPALVPLFLVLTAFLKDSWWWTLVNDHSFLFSGTNFQGRFQGLFTTFLGYGQLKWTGILRYAAAYTAFANAPKLFFLYQWLEIIVMMAVWGALACRLTGRRSAFLLVPSVTLTMRYFYDAFFFPTLLDSFAMLVFGVGLLVLSGAEPFILHADKIPAGRRWRWIAALIVFVLALGAMEFDLAGIMATGIALCWVHWGRRDRDVRVIGAGVFLIAAALLYGIFLKTVISHGYSSAYSLTDFHKILVNLLTWGRQVLLFHLPWIIGGVFVLVKTRGQYIWERYSPGERFGIVLGVLMYGAWLAILLPWNATGYHAVPLGIVFSFLVAVALAGPLEELDRMWLSPIVAAALLLNIWVAQQEIYTHRMYNANVQQLLHFIRGNTSFRQAARDGKVFCNQDEPAVALPGWANSTVPLGLKPFVYDEDIADAVAKGAAYYVFMSWGKPLGTYLNVPGWEPVSVNEFCKVYKKQ